MQRPHSLEHTKVLASGDVFHYSCNAPSKAVLDRHGIRAIGKDLNCEDAREVLVIPGKVYGQYGYSLEENSVQIVSEQLLRSLR
ncbi:MAG: hypothetical protein CMH63_00070 [Nanoarchaeota archaeon]|nr:hypothetical protein [Nanoarchaeota archaeon]|tara:strand:- start:1986 stop:2237 length:252 start_codon:yes stop_codon:yes gene_type:complete